MRQLKNIKFFLRGLIAIFAIAAISISCERREDPYYPKAHPAKYNITGQVLNQQNGQPIEGVRVDMGSLNTNTDTDGKFKFLNLESGGSYTITLTKDDFFTTAYTIEFPSAQPNSVINIAVTASMVPYIEGVTPISPVTGGTIDILGELNGTAVIQPNTVVTDSNGDPVEGEINFTAIEIPPFESGSTNNPSVITILFGPAGLQFSKPIQISFDNPFTNFTFNEIQLEYYNSTTGEWVIESVPVTYNSSTNRYETSISHFSIYKVSYLAEIDPLAPVSQPIDVIEFPEIKNYDMSVPLLVEEIKVERLAGYKFTTPLSSVLSTNGITGVDAVKIKAVIETAINKYTGTDTPLDNFDLIVDDIPMGIEIAYRTGMNTVGSQEITKFKYSIKLNDSANQPITIVVEVQKAGAVTLSYSFFHLDWHDHGHGGGGTP
ncbi:MAG: carboxypeptidase-like regulatory domain-containing protein [Bacteroidales bacterium]